MRIAAFFLLISLTGFAAGCGKTTPATPSGEPAPNTASDKDRLQGMWAVETVDVADPKHKPPPGEIEGIRFVFEGDKFRIVDPKRTHQNKFTFALDASQTPKVFTVTELDEKDQPLPRFKPDNVKSDEIERHEWIYKFDGDSLVLAFRKGDGGRPKDFKPDAGTPSSGGATHKSGKVEPFKPGISPVLVVKMKKVNEPIPPESKRSVPTRAGTRSK